MNIKIRREGRVAYVEFNPGDGTRYAASGFQLPWPVEGGGAEEHYLVSIISPTPYQRTYAIGGPGHGELIETYTVEHFRPLGGFDPYYEEAGRYAVAVMAAAITGRSLYAFTDQGPACLFDPIEGLDEEALRDIARKGAFA